MDFTMFADFVLAVDSWINGFGMLSGETEMAGEMSALESLENVELAEIESVELANAETVTIETVEGEVVEVEAAAESGSSIGNVVNCNENSNKYISNFGKMSEEDAIRYDGYWKYQEALKNGEFKNGSIYDGWYKPDGTMNYPDNGGAIPGTEEIISIGNNNITELGRYGMPTGTSKYLTETGISADRLALPPTTNSDEYIIYRINGTIDNVERSVVAPWVGDKGLGIQYKLPKPIQWYIEHGILIPE